MKTTCAPLSIHLREHTGLLGPSSCAVRRAGPHPPPACANSPESPLVWSTTLSAPNFLRNPGPGRLKTADLEQRLASPSTEAWRRLRPPSCFVDHVRGAAGERNASTPRRAAINEVKALREDTSIRRTADQSPYRLVLGRSHPELLERHCRTSRSLAPGRHRESAPHLRAARPRSRRRDDRPLRRQMHLPPLATDHRDPRRRHRRRPAQTTWTPFANPG